MSLTLRSLAWCDLGGKDPEFASISDKDGELRVVRLADRLPTKDDPNELQPQVIHPPVAESSALLTTLANLSGQTGLEDVVVADTDGASIYAYARKANGRLGEDTAYPCLKGITSIGRIRMPGETSDRILVCSAGEKMAGLAAYKDGRIEFPAALPLTTEPFLAQPIQLGADPCKSIVVATRDGQRFNLEVLSWDPATKAWKSRIVKMGTIARDPSDLIVRDLNNDGREDVIVLFPREAARIVAQAADGSLVEACADSALRLSQFDNLTTDTLGFGDFDGDGKEDILVAKTGFVRAYKFSADNQLSLIDQANSKTTADRLSAPALVDIDNDGTMKLVVYDEADGALQVLARKGTLFGYQRSISVGKIDPRQILRTGTAGAKGLLIAGSRVIWSLPISGSQWLADTRTSGRTKVKDARFYDLTTGDINGDGADEMIAIDAVNHGIEIFARTKEGLRSISAFTVFSDERLVGRQRGRLEDEMATPRDVITADIDNDGRADLAVLCHDRLLVYPQMK